MALSISTEGVGTCERLLEKSGAIQRLEPYRNMAVVRIDSELPSLIDLIPKRSKWRRQVLRLVEKEVGDSRYEPVYIQPTRWISQGLTKERINRSLRELAELESFDYVPPFRGRSIHVPDRTVQFDRLSIDFDTLDKRRELDFAKLQNMVTYAESGRCRQLAMMSYFGDKTTSTCGSCDNCRQQSGSDFGEPSVMPAPEATSPALLQAARMALSG
ncbi:MAG: RecQ family zinc-binding domain-containing protein, partial [Planctomycetales bacterium]|nr:RecQ family zinc-binding domain-containing protein [Planctomycetales bacterium]